MDNIVGIIVLVLAWHMCGDDSVIKCPQPKHFFAATAAFSEKFP